MLHIVTDSKNDITNEYDVRLERTASWFNWNTEFYRKETFQINSHDARLQKDPCYDCLVLFR